MSTPFRIIHLTDTHLFKDVSQTLLGVNTQKSFDAAIELLKNSMDKIDMILVTGDLSQDGSRASYLRLADMLTIFQVPVYYVPGNHDDSAVMQEVYPRGNIKTKKHVVINDWQLILLDSHQHQKVSGYLSQSELDFLTSCLKTYPLHQAMIAFHHHPLSVGSTWLDKLGITNAEALWEVLSQFSHVNTLLFGHVHQLQEGEKAGIRYYSTPSTCIQFKRNSSKFALEKIPPSYRVIELYPQGKIVTTVKMVRDYVGEFVVDAKGY